MVWDDVGMGRSRLGRVTGGVLELCVELGGGGRRKGDLGGGGAT